jgi:hypothetical protein
LICNTSTPKPTSRLICTSAVKYLSGNGADQVSGFAGGSPISGMKT